MIFSCDRTQSECLELFSYMQVQRSDLVILVLNLSKIKLSAARVILEFLTWYLWQRGMCAVHCAAISFMSTSSDWFAEHGEASYRNNGVGYSNLKHDSSKKKNGSITRKLLMPQTQSKFNKDRLLSIEQ